MITLTNPETREARLYACNQTDFTNGDHLPINGHISEGRYKLRNFDQLIVMDTGDVYVFDAEEQHWKEL